MKQLSIYEMSLLIKVLKFESNEECLNYFSDNYNGLFNENELLTVYKEYNK